MRIASIMGVRNPERAQHQELPERLPGPWRPCTAHSIWAASLPRGQRVQDDTWGLGPALLAGQGHHAAEEEMSLAPGGLGPVSSPFQASVSPSAQ